eukprot:782274-Pyramimonas_sp.AAC.1
MSSILTRLWEVCRGPGNIARGSWPSSSTWTAATPARANPGLVGKSHPPPRLCKSPRQLGS